MEINKAKDIVIGVLVVLLVVSLWNNLKKDDSLSSIISVDNKETSNRVALTEAELFQKKQECQKYRPEVEARLKIRNNIVPETKTEITNVLDKIFYSPKVNSCLFSASSIIFVSEVPSLESNTLSDVLTGEVYLFSSARMAYDDESVQKLEDTRKKFSNDVKDYQ